ncbi:MAG: 4Fe-4S dicluster domain-containing protein [Archangiaceae bacterium]|nr:4Fe-4S dicluster domain-containing protein [Archangiaceae bacterium]
MGESEKRPFALLRSSWARRHGAADDAAFAHTFERWVQAGVVPGSAFPSESAAIDLHAIAHAPRAGLSPGLELAFARDAKLHDGRFANTPWLQELPDPVTQLVWDNAALMSPATAAKLGLTGPTQGQPGPPGVKACARVKLSVTGRGLNASVTAPVLVLPGHADDCITLPLGYGHTGSGERVAQSVGFSAYVLRHSDAPYFSPVEASRVDGTHLLVTTQQHWALDGNPPARQLTLAELAKEKPGARAAPQGAEHQWGMAIDLSRCSGCSACVTACQAENNLPVVGREAVAQGREMFWMRVDRYATEGGTSISQPVACQHCADAPCERACPVSATSHTPEGLNVMAYGRCVGSRACGTACPYKVRRFNYLDLNQSLTPLERMRANPEVPLRAKGVMEKCTFCAQRIERAKRELPRLTDGAVRTACQQACPTQAIAFGDLNDAASQVSRWHQDPRRYALLSETGMKPRNLYLARVKNPNPELQ